MDRNGNIYQAPEDEIPTDDKARLDGYLRAHAEMREMKGAKMARAALAERDAQRHERDVQRQTGSTVVFFGSSDDLIEVEGHVSGCDEYTGEFATFVVIGTEAKVRIKARYEDPGVWSLSVAPVDEGIPMLPVTITGSGYTARATVEGVQMVIYEAEKP